MNQPLSIKFKIICTIVGAIALFIHVAINAGSIDIAVKMIAKLTVCTLGIGLIMYLSISFAIGYVIVGPIWLLIKYFNKQSASNLEKMPPSIAKSPEQIALVEYIKKAQNKGMSETQITVRLEAQGWNSRDIEMARNFANADSN